MWSSAALLASAAAVAMAGPFIHDISLGEHYPYAVSLPYNNTETLPPAIVFLGGKGSLFDAVQTASRDTVVSYGGPGWRVMKYYNGSREEADVMAAERFVNIIPYQYWWEQPPDAGMGEPNYTWSAIRDVVEDAKSKYPFDPSRVYLTGYSMGARAMWPIMESDESYYASAAVVAGTPTDTDGLSNMTNLPLRQYAGELDYEPVSQVYQHQRINDQLVALGDTVCEVVTLNATHEEMQQVAYDVDLFSWFLSHNNSESDQALASAEATDSAKPEEYSSLYSSASTYTESGIGSFSMSAMGLPTASRPAKPSFSGASDRQNAKADDSDSSSASSVAPQVAALGLTLLAYLSL